MSRCLRIGYSKQQLLGTSCVGGIGNHPSSNGEYNWRSKVHPPLQSINFSPERHHHSKRLLRRISEEFDLEMTADEMAFVEHNDFQRSSASNNEPQGPQYYGSGLGDSSFVEEDDDDYEFLLDEALARDGLYRGLSSVILCLYIQRRLICTRQLQEYVDLVHSGTDDYVTFIHLSRPGSCTSVYSSNTFALPLSALSAFPYSRSPNCNRTLVFVLPPQRLSLRNSTLHRIFFLVIMQHNNPYSRISNSTNNFQLPSPSNRHPYFTYPILLLLFYQTSRTTLLSDMERRCFQACMVGCPWLGSS